MSTQATEFPPQYSGSNLYMQANLSQSSTEHANQMDLFGNVVTAESQYSPEAAARDTEDLRMLVGSVLVATAFKIGNQEAAADLMGDARRYMEAWEMQRQFDEIVQWNMKMHNYAAQANAEASDASSTSTPTKKKSGRTKTTASSPKTATLLDLVPLRGQSGTEQRVA